MKNWKTLALSALLILIGTATAPLDPLQDGLVAYYTFNQCDARDDSGGDSNGKLFGKVGCWCGIEDKGLLFDGTNGYVEFYGAVNDYFQTSDFTISFYFKPDQYSIFRQSMLSKRMECDEYQMLDLLLDMNQKEINTNVYETPGKYYPNISPALVSNGWHHIVLVRDGFMAQTFINGDLQREGLRCSGVDITNEAVLSFANSPCINAKGVRRFKGILDELRIYNRALSSEEVRALYQLYPIENPMMDCTTYHFDKNLLKTDYLCALKSISSFQKM